VANVATLDHPAASLLASYRDTGVPVSIATEPRTLALEAAVTRGPHPIAMAHREFLREEFQAMATKGHWLRLPYHVARGLPGLHLSPLGVVPQAERRPRTIVDYTYSNVNQATVKQAPAEAMQFGRTLHRVLQSIVYADPRGDPVHLFKLDIADGFYRVWIKPDDVPKLGVVLPAEGDDEAQVAFPLALPMGWVTRRRIERSRCQ
jgi:hypothetical protein